MSNLYYYNRKRKQAKKRAQKRALNPFTVITYKADDPTQTISVDRFPTYQSAQAFCDANNGDGSPIHSYIL